MRDFVYQMVTNGDSDTCFWTKFQTLTDMHVRDCEQQCWVEIDFVHDRTGRCLEVPILNFKCSGCKSPWSVSHNKEY